MDPLIVFFVVFGPIVWVTTIWVLIRIWKAPDAR